MFSRPAKPAWNAGQEGGLRKLQRAVQVTVVDSVVAGQRLVEDRAARELMGWSAEKRIKEMGKLEVQCEARS
ncbi:MAG: hypothetical protein D6753_10305 [Planctomycetota bacterium]|nr:MAG: hypothetical protein D6753_10305 [Planctomycetota bacterium]